jgi:hypothetical protein
VSPAIGPALRPVAAEPPRVQAPARPLDPAGPTPGVNPPKPPVDDKGG